MTTASGLPGPLSRDVGPQQGSVAGFQCEKAFGANSSSIPGVPLNKLKAAAVPGPVLQRADRRINDPEWVKKELEKLAASKRVEGRTLDNSTGPCTIGALDSRPNNRDVAYWTARISEHTKCGRGRQALAVYDEMREAGVRLSSYSVIAALKACSSLQDLEWCKKIHDHLIDGQLETNVFVGNMLVDTYGKCGSLVDARLAFDKITNRTVVSWNSMILGYAQMQEGEMALQMYQRMQLEGMVPNDRTFVNVLKACSSLVASRDAKECDLALVKKQTLQQVRDIHKTVVMRGFETDAFVGTMLVDAYAKCGSLADARHVFEKMPRRSVVSWNAIILGYAQMERGMEALELYARMQEEGMVPNDRTFVSVLKGCSSLAVLEEGQKSVGVIVKSQCLEQVRAIHSDLLKGKFESDLYVGNMLVDAYAKCGSLVDARRVFEGMPHRNVVSWTAMILGYAQMEEGEEALTLYTRMQEEGVVANDCTYLGALKACATVGALQQGKEIHEHIKEQGLEADVDVGSSLVNLYTKCGSLVDARRVFDGLPSKNVVTWNALVYGYAKGGNVEMAGKCFEEMRQQGLQPDEATFTSLLVACCHGALVDAGQQYFKMMVEYKIAPSVYHYSCMVDLLGRSGRLDEAEQLLQGMPFEKDLVGWTALLTACRSHGDVERGERCFKHLIELEPENAVAYVLLGNIYANAGRWEDVDRVESLRISAGAWKKPARACIEVQRKVHEFTVGEERSDVSEKVRNMRPGLKQGGHVPHTDLVLKAVSEQHKEDALCGHAEKLALAFGLLNTPDGTTLLVTKNLRMCNDCHSSTKVMSRVEKREIVVRDAHRLHRFVGGSCSCGDRH